MGKFTSHTDRELPERDTQKSASGTNQDKVQDCLITAEMPVELRFGRECGSSAEIEVALPEIQDTLGNLVYTFARLLEEWFTSSSSKYQQIQSVKINTEESMVNNLQLDWVEEEERFSGAAGLKICLCFEYHSEDDLEDAVSDSIRYILRVVAGRIEMESEHYSWMIYEDGGLLVTPAPSPRTSAMAAALLAGVASSFNPDASNEQKMVHSSPAVRQANRKQQKTTSQQKSSAEKLEDGWETGAKKLLDKIRDLPFAKRRSACLARERAMAKGASERFGLLDWDQINRDKNSKRKFRPIRGVMAEVASLLTSTKLHPISGVPANEKLAFQLLQSKAFVSSLNDVLSRRAMGLDSGAGVSSKDSENAIREAFGVMFDIGPMDTYPFGKWHDADGNEYVVEILREYSGIAPNDIIVIAHPADGGPPQRFAIQCKSYQLTSSTGIIPEPGRTRATEKLKIPFPSVRAKVITAEDGSNYVSQDATLLAAIDKLQERLVMTNVFMDSAPYNQQTRLVDDTGKSYAGDTEWVTQQNRVLKSQVREFLLFSNPGDLLNSFERHGKNNTMEATIYVPMAGGNTIPVSIRTNLSTYYNEQTDSWGVNPISDVEVSLSIPVDGFHIIETTTYPAQSLVVSTIEGIQNEKERGLPVESDPMKNKVLELINKYDEQ